jgi:hypothetical protein
LMSKFRIVLIACQTFMESDKPSSLVTIMLNRTTLLQGSSMERE